MSWSKPYYPITISAMSASSPANLASMQRSHITHIVVAKLATPAVTLRAVFGGAKLSPPEAPGREGDSEVTSTEGLVRQGLHSVTPCRQFARRASACMARARRVSGYRLLVAINH